MSYIDFIVNLDKKPDTDIGKAVIKRITTKRLEAKKPSIIFLAGDSGEGKSMTALRLLEEGQDSVDLENQIIYTPYEYPKKVKNILFNREYRHLKYLVFMESRELVKAKMWYTVINQAISDVNALSRSVRPLCFLVVSQDISDVEKEVRKTLNYYGFCIRPQQDKTRFYLYKIWKSRYNIDNPKMTLRKLNGIIIKNKEVDKLEIQKFIMNLPSKEIKDAFEKLDFQAKAEIIMKKLTILEQALEKELPKLTKLEQLVEVVVREASALSWILTRTRSGKIKVKEDFKKIYGLTSEELKEFEKLLIGKLREVGMMSDDEKNIEKDGESVGRLS